MTYNDLQPGTVFYILGNRTPQTVRLKSGQFIITDEYIIDLAEELRFKVRDINLRRNLDRYETASKLSTNEYLSKYDLRELKVDWYQTVRNNNLSGGGSG